MGWGCGAGHPAGNGSEATRTCGMHTGGAGRQILEERRRGMKHRILRGRFRTARAQRTHSANHDGVHPRNTPAHHPPTEACMIHSKQHRGCRMQDPGTCGHRRWKTADFAHSTWCAPLAIINPRDTGIRSLLTRSVPNVALSSPQSCDYRMLRGLIGLRVGSQCRGGGGGGGPAP